MPNTEVDAKTFQTGYSEITTSDIGVFLQRDLTVREQALVESLISEVEAEVCEQCNRQFAYSGLNFIETLDCGHYIYRLHNFPITTIEVVEVDGVAQTLVKGSDYFIYPTHLNFVNAPQSSIDNRRSLEIQYTISKFWGDDVIFLIKRYVSHLFLNSDNAGVASTDRSFANLSETLDLPELQRSMSKVITRYKNYVL